MATAPAAADAPSERLVRVTGTGAVLARPDVATIESGALSVAATAAAALAENNRVQEAVFAALTEAGVARKDIRTTAFNVYPQFEPEPSSLRGPRIIGYQVMNSVSVTVRDVAMLGTILDRLVAAVANQIGGISFTVAEPEALLDRARLAAVADAARKAALYATAAAATLGPVLSIEEQGGGAPAPYLKMAEAAMSATPIAPGTTELSVTVGVTYALE
ncbi:MAG: DUF541 domain-containing protein [Alphaproteobacteria bacterium]|nr:DUF541 domain-containing protein [Alphaproteobacteria bacterium]